METPVLFLTYKRFDTAEKVFEAIRGAKPSTLYFASNAPNPKNHDEYKKVARVRELIKRIDWPCCLNTRFIENHLPVKQSISSSIDWFFENEEQGIILEDDCLPHPDFFSYCEKLLNHYAQDDRVWVVTGDNFQNGQSRGDASYYFSRINHVWGWASWRRAWLKRDMEIKFWPEWKNSKEWNELWVDPVARRYWRRTFDLVYQDKIKTWDYPWTACIWYQNGLTATPNVNLVSNIGFGSDGTNTLDKNSKLSQLPTKSIGLIRHPEEVIEDREADRYVFDHHFGGMSRRLPLALFVFPLRLTRKAIKTICNLKSLILSNKY